MSQPCLVLRKGGVASVGPPPPPPPGKVNWNAGHYMGSYNFITSQGGSTSGGVTLSYEYNNLIPFNNIIGYKMYITWGAICQSAPGGIPTFDLTSIANTLTALKAMTPKRRLVVTLMGGRFSYQDMPAYVTSNAAMGASPDGVTHGWWGAGTASNNYEPASPAYHRPLVNAEFNKAVVAILNAFGSDPYFEGIMFQENSFFVGILQNAPDWSDGAYNNSQQATVSAAVAAAPTTNVCYQNTWTAGTVDQGVAFEQFMVGARCMPGNSDTYGFSFTDPQLSQGLNSHISWGPAAYMGIYANAPPPDTQADMRPQTRFWCDVENEDLGIDFSNGYSWQDILKAIQLDFKGSHAFWNFSQSGSSQIFAGNLWGTNVGDGFLADGVNNPVNAIQNTTYPQNYP